MSPVSPSPIQIIKACSTQPECDFRFPISGECNLGTLTHQVADLYEERGARIASKSEKIAGVCFRQNGTSYSAVFTVYEKGGPRKHNELRFSCRALPVPKRY